MSHLWAIDHLTMELSILVVHKEKNMIVNGTPFTNVSNQDEIKMKSPKSFVKNEIPTTSAKSGI